MILCDAEARGNHQVSFSLSTLVFEAGSLTQLEHTASVRLVGQPNFGIRLCLPAWAYFCACLFTLVLRTEFRSSCSCDKDSTDWASSPSPSQVLQRTRTVVTLVSLWALTPREVGEHGGSSTERDGIGKWDGREEITCERGQPWWNGVPEPPACLALPMAGRAIAGKKAKRQRGLPWPCSWTTFLRNRTPLDIHLKFPMRFLNKAPPPTAPVWYKLKKTINLKEWPRMARVVTSKWPELRCLISRYIARGTN